MSLLRRDAEIPADVNPQVDAVLSDYMRRVYLVDDDESVLRALSRLLRRYCTLDEDPCIQVFSYLAMQRVLRYP
jgi:hypothetical protein